MKAFASLAVVSVCLVFLGAGNQPHPSPPSPSQPSPLPAPNQVRVPLSWSTPEEMHDFFAQAFVDAPFFGVRRTIQPSFPRPDIIVLGGQEYRVEAIQLLGLLKHDSPVVYEEGTALPTRHTPRVATTRELDGFEGEALVRLRQEEPLVVARSADELRGLGALRAENQCLACHDVESGALLGALSYELKVPDVPL